MLDYFLSDGNTNARFKHFLENLGSICSSSCLRNSGINSQHFEACGLLTDHWPFINLAFKRMLKILFNVCCVLNISTTQTYSSWIYAEGGKLSEKQKFVILRFDLNRVSGKSGYYYLKIKQSIDLQGTCIPGKLSALYHHVKNYLYFYVKWVHI